MSYYADYQQRMAEKRAEEVRRIEYAKQTAPEICPGCGCRTYWFLNPITEQLECSCYSPDRYGYGCGYRWEPALPA